MPSEVYTARQEGVATLLPVLKDRVPVARGNR